MANNKDGIANKFKMLEHLGFLELRLKRALELDTVPKDWLVRLRYVEVDLIALRKEVDKSVEPLIKLIGRKEDYEKKET